MEPAPADLARFAMRSLREALTRLAASPGEQATWLKSVGAHTDELALELDEVMLIIPTAEEEGLISGAVLTEVKTINALLAEMTGSPDDGEWTLDALDTSPRWARVRDLAAVALRAL